MKTVRFVGMGALGLLFAEPILTNAADTSLSFVMDPERLSRHKNDRYTINGEEVHYRMITPEEAAAEGPADLVFVGVKYPELESALKTMETSVGENTTIISMMNGVDSEEILGKKFGREKVLFNVSQGMDAQRYGTDLKYTQHGKLYVGVPTPEQLAAPSGEVTQDILALHETLMGKLKAVYAFFDQVKMPYVQEGEILYRIWSKFMLNVGCNQVCMVYDKGYGPCMVPGSQEFAMMAGAMREVCIIAQAKGIPVGEKEVKQYWDIERTLDPNAVPSMGQDRRQKRKSEVDMFAGAVIRMGKELGLEMPVNEYLLARVREIEAEY